MSIAAPAPAIYLAVSYDTLHYLRVVFEQAEKLAEKCARMSGLKNPEQVAHEVLNVLNEIEAHLQKQPMDTDVSDLL